MRGTVGMSFRNEMEAGTLEPTWLTPTSRETLVLSPKGHVEHSLHLVDDGETTWITTEPGAGEPGAMRRMPSSMHSTSLSAFSFSTVNRMSPSRMFFLSKVSPDESGNPFFAASFAVAVATWSSEARSFVAGGHELASHGYAHLRASDQNLVEFTREAPADPGRLSRQYIVGADGSRTATLHVSFHGTPAIIRRLPSKYFR